MIHVDFDPATLTRDQKTWWDAWQVRVDTATRAAIQAWETSPDRGTGKVKIAFDNAIWGDLKDWLLQNFFHGKCAYCEAPLARSFPPAEHYRPKGKVEYKPAGATKMVKPKTMDEKGNQITHPGYFWLAYHWKNLVPSCSLCNSGQGKQNQFPATGSYLMVKKLTAAEAAALGDYRYRSIAQPDIVYLEPDELDALEKPLLLHPYRSEGDDPRKHLCFGERGIEAAREIDGAPSPKGQNSIQVYNLQDDELRRKRSLRQMDSRNAFLLCLAGELANNATVQEALQNVWTRAALKDLKEGRLEYSAAALDAIGLLCRTMGLAES
jgi:hypothetical protein